MKKREILTNAIMSVTQIIVTGGVLFLLYGFLLKVLGVEKLGIWSLVLATTSVTQVANLGLSGGVVKFVAKYMAREDSQKVSDILQTAAISVAIFIGLVLIICYPVIQWILSITIAPDSIRPAIEILPLAVFSFWLLAVGGVFQSGLDGCQKIHAKTLVLMVSTLFFLGLCLLLVPRKGLIGLAYAQVIQNALVLLATWIVLRKYLPFLPLVPKRWHKPIFKEIIGYGVKFQAISVASMLYDPITKAFLTKFGGLSMVGYYEMASKMIQQFRAVVISANRVLVPAIADLTERLPEKIALVYDTSYRLIFYLSLPLYSLLIACTPIISEVWIGYYESIFVMFSILLSVGWFLNTLSAPAYFMNLGTGDLRWNVLGHITIGLLNAGLGLILGLLYGGKGVVLAWVFSLGLGSGMIYAAYQIRHSIPLGELIPRDSRQITFACLLGILLTGVLYYRFTKSLNPLALNGLILFTFAAVLFMPFWFHPMRRRIYGWLTTDLLRKH